MVSFVATVELALFVAATSLVPGALAKNNRPVTQDPFADPKHDLNNPLRYIPSNTLSAIGVTLYFIVSCLMVYLLNKSRWSARYMLCVIIGGFAMTFGLAMRFALAKKPDSSGIYIVEYLFVVLSPCAFIAGNYILLGRLSRHLRMGHLLLVNPAKITKIFVASDITTFLIQASGGGLSTAQSISTAEAGSHIFLAGLALQLVSYFFFTVVYLTFLYRVHKFDNQSVWRSSKSLDADGSAWGSGPSSRGYRWWRDWRALAGALCLSCVGILIRSVYRTIELSQGYVGPLATNEATFYGLDTLPLFVAVTIYIFFWPGRFIDEERIRREERETKEIGEGEVSSASGERHDVEVGSVGKEKEGERSALDSEREGTAVGHED